MPLSAKQRAELVRKATEKRQTTDSTKVDVVKELTSALKGVAVKGDKGDKGEPGRDGKDGKPGKDGQPGKDGKNGRDGIDGLPGKNGKDGKDGKPGQDGLTGSMPAHERSGNRLRFENPDGTWGNWMLVGSRSVTAVGGGGGGQKYSTDNAVIEAANAPNSTLSYTGDLLTGVAFTDTTDITNNSKVYAYDVSDVLQTVTHTFDYLAQTWTVTTTLSYTSGKLTGKSTTIGKV